MTVKINEVFLELNWAELFKKKKEKQIYTVLFLNDRRRAERRIKLKRFFNYQSDLDPKERSTFFLSSAHSFHSKTRLAAAVMKANFPD